jgi:hypothetical protein
MGLLYLFFLSLSAVQTNLGLRVKRPNISVRFFPNLGVFSVGFFFFRSLQHEIFTKIRPVAAVLMHAD